MLKRKKKKGFQLWWAGEKESGPAKRGVRAREGAGPAAAQGKGRRGRAKVTTSPRAHMPARAEGENGVTVDGGDEPAVRGEDSAAGGLGGGLPPVARFLDSVQVS
jgi:hypothetical protein